MSKFLPAVKDKTGYRIKFTSVERCASWEVYQTDGVSTVEFTGFPLDKVPRKNGDSGHVTVFAAEHGSKATKHTITTLSVNQARELRDWLTQVLGS